MQLPNWVNEAIRRFTPPATGKVVIELECYKNGITKIEIGGTTRIKPERCMTCEAGEACPTHPPGYWNEASPQYGKLESVK